MIRSLTFPSSDLMLLSWPMIDRKDKSSFMDYGLYMVRRGKWGEDGALKDFSLSCFAIALFIKTKKIALLSEPKRTSWNYF